MKVFTILVTGWKKIRFYVPMAKIGSNLNYLPLNRITSNPSIFD